MVNRNRTVQRSRKKFIGRVGELCHGTSKKFTLHCDGAMLEAMLINYEDRLFAYVNRCRHISLSLDWVDNQFFTEDKRYLICANHGATYEPVSGECVWGPCFGEFLERVRLEIEEEKIFALCPEESEGRARDPR